MTEKKMVFSCCDDQNLCEGYKCEVEETDKGLCVCITSDDPEKVTRLKEKVSSCGCATDKKSCC